MKRTLSTLIPLLAAAGCTVENQWGGTSVGNPGEATAQAAAMDDASYLSGAMEVESVELTDCAGGVDLAPLGQILDPTMIDPFPLSAGTWCGLALNLAGPLELTGAGDAGGEFSLSLELGAIAVTSAGFDVDGDAFVLEIGAPGWIGAAELGLDAGDVEVGAGDPMHALLRERIEEGSALYLDADGDGSLSDAERADGALAVGEEEDDEEDDEEDSGR